MEIYNFITFIKDSRNELRNALEADKGTKEVLLPILKRQLGACCSTFEETTLKENLQEEFGLYMDSLPKGA